jgi:ribosomal protein S18 acetylase RimI-like enzyme
MSSQRLAVKDFMLYSPHASASLDVIAHDTWEITYLRVDNEFRGQGYGRLLLNRVLRAADARGKVLELYVSSGDINRMDDRALQAWYERNGFVCINSLTWRREPQLLSTTEVEVEEELCTP